MSPSTWLGIGLLVVLAGCVFMGMRSGRRQFQAHTAQTAAEAFASGEAAAEAALMAKLSQHVTVVAGNDSRSYGPAAAGDELGGIPGWVHRGLGVPDLEALSAADAAPAIGPVPEWPAPSVEEVNRDDRMVLSRSTDAAVRADELRRESSRSHRFGSEVNPPYHRRPGLYPDDIDDGEDW